MRRGGSRARIGAAKRPLSQKPNGRAFFAALGLARDAL